EFELVGQLDRLAAVEYPADPALQARIKAYELAFRMQAAFPDIVALDNESKQTRRLYGLDNPVTRPFGRQRLVARRLVGRWARFPCRGQEELGDSHPSDYITTAGTGPEPAGEPRTETARYRTRRSDYRNPCVIVRSP